MFFQIGNAATFVFTHRYHHLALTLACCTLLRWLSRCASTTSTRLYFTFGCCSEFVLASEVFVGKSSGIDSQGLGDGLDMIQHSFSLVLGGIPNDYWVSWLLPGMLWGRTRVCFKSAQYELCYGFVSYLRFWNAYLNRHCILHSLCLCSLTSCSQRSPCGWCLRYP